MQISFLFSYRQIYLRYQSCDPQMQHMFYFTFLFGRAVYKRRNGKVMQPQITNASVQAVVFSEKEKLLCTSGSRERAASHRAQTETINRSCVVYLLQKASHRGKYSSDKTLTQNSLQLTRTHLLNLTYRNTSPKKIWAGQALLQMFF